MRERTAARRRKELRIDGILLYVCVRMVLFGIGQGVCTAVDSMQSFVGYCFIHESCWAMKTRFRVLIGQ